MKINPKAYAEDCDCGTPAGIPCPHTPIRCKHEFKYACEEAIKVTQDSVLYVDFYK